MCLAAIGEVLGVRDEEGVLLAEIQFTDKTMTVGADFVPGVAPGMFVVVHAGLAVQLLTPDEAAEALALRAEIDSAEA